MIKLKQSSWWHRAYTDIQPCSYPHCITRDYVWRHCFSYTIPRNYHRNVTFNPLSAKVFNLIFTHLKLCLATAIHNFKWVKIIHICLIWDRIFTVPNDWTSIYLTKTSIWCDWKVLQTIIVVHSAWRVNDASFCDIHHVHRRLG